MTSLKKMVHFIQIRMQDGNENVSTINLRVFMSYIIHFCAEIRKIIFYYTLVDRWGNASIDLATGSWESHFCMHLVMYFYDHS